ncbi:MAG TPA: ABC transporter ATP-binding protein [Caldithrix sp.]|nr:ABC transporter ATP-binding protein [Caldithrix sp.]
MPADNPIIQINGLRKTYKNAKLPALNGLDLSIIKGEVFGLLGPNGAGKTTTISILCGLMNFDHGEIRVQTKDLQKNLSEIKKLIGVAPQEIALYDKLTLMENLKYFARIYGVNKSKQEINITEILKLLGLENKADHLLGTYSGGMKRRANLAAAVLHKPEILYLDEPTVGVDVQSRKVILDYILQLKQQGATVVYTSHYLEEAEKICDRIAIIDHGKKIAEGRPGELTEKNEPGTNLEKLFIELTGSALRD